MNKEKLDAESFRPTKKKVAFIDSDGCAFDTMEIKHKECFCPAAINGWDLQSVSSLAREVWEFVNLYSVTRGCSRFNAIIRVLSLLEERPEAKERGFRAPRRDRFQKWVETAKVLNNDALKEKEGDEQFDRALRWSLDANRRVREMVRGIPPFPFVRESLEMLNDEADIIICSATPREALAKEWSENGIIGFVSLLGAQEDGTKKEIIAAVKGYYSPDSALMIGDAPGDAAAAAANGIRFYPIRPLDEIGSWREFYSDAASLFVEGKYDSAAEKSYMDRFEKLLPSEPPWKRKETND